MAWILLCKAVYLVPKYVVIMETIIFSKGLFLVHPVDTYSYLLFYVLTKLHTKLPSVRLSADRLLPHYLFRLGEDVYKVETMTCVILWRIPVGRGEVFPDVIDIISNWNGWRDYMFGRQCQIQRVCRCTSYRYVHLCINDGKPMYRLCSGRTS